MPSWGELLNELQQMAVPPDPFDYVRSRSIRDLQNHTGRDTILYASAHLQRPDIPSLTSIDHSDLTGFMEVVEPLGSPELDLILHSPGGSIEAAESIGEYLRASFESIRVIVPQMAMSAATLLTLVGDEVLMGPHSQLGPIDPQFILQTPFGIRSVAAQAILEQFDRARRACLDNPDEYPVWAEMLQQYGPDLLEESANAIALSTQIAQDWLNRFTFSSLQEGSRDQRSKRVADYLADHNTHLTHARGVFASELRDFDSDLPIVDLESDRQLHELTLTVHYSAMHTFGNTRAAKLIQNHLGNAYVILDNAGE